MIERVVGGEGGGQTFSIATAEWGAKYLRASRAKGTKLTNLSCTRTLPCLCLLLLFSVYLLLLLLMLLLLLLLLLLCGCLPGNRKLRTRILIGILNATRLVSHKQRQMWVFIFRIVGGVTTSYNNNSNHNNSNNSKNSNNSNVVAGQ